MGFQKMNTLLKMSTLGFEKVFCTCNRFGSKLLRHPFIQPAASFSTLQRPSRPCGSFGLFIKDKKDDYPQELKIGGNYFKILSEEWKQLPEMEKQKYVDEARSAMDKYKKELQSLTDFERDELKSERKQKRLSKIKRRNKKEKVAMGLPKRPLTAYNLFVKMLFDNKEASYFGKFTTAWWSDVRLKWNALTDKKKLKLIDQAQEDKERYMLEMQQFVVKAREADMERLIPKKYQKMKIDSSQNISWDKTLSNWPKK